MGNTVPRLKFVGFKLSEVTLQRLDWIVESFKNPLHDGFFRNVANRTDVIRMLVSDRYKQLNEPPSATMETPKAKPTTRRAKPVTKKPAKKKASKS